MTGAKYNFFQLINRARESRIRGSGSFVECIAIITYFNARSFRPALFISPRLDHVPKVSIPSRNAVTDF